MNLNSPDNLYGSRATLYDLIYHNKPYATEAARLCDLLHSLGITDGSRVVEAACGTGSHLVHLRQRFNVAGFDISDEMLAIAREKLPGVELFRADMADVRLERPADALVCLFSSIGYLHPIGRLRQAAACFARIVRPGGALIVEPWVAPEEYVPGRPWMDAHQADDLKLCRAIVSRREGEMALLDFHWLVARRNARDVEHFTERHALWLCPRKAMVDVFSQAGFDCRIEPEGLMKGRGLIIGTRRTN